MCYYSEVDNDAKIRAQLLERMAEKGARQADLARQLGVSPQALSQILKGDRGKLPSSLVAVLDALDVELTVQPKGNNHDQ